MARFLISNFANLWDIITKFKVAQYGSIAYANGIGHCQTKNSPVCSVNRFAKLNAHQI